MVNETELSPELSPEQAALKAASPEVTTLQALEEGAAKLFFHPSGNVNMAHPTSGQVFSFVGGFLAAVEPSVVEWMDKEVLSPLTLVRDATVEELTAYKAKLAGIIEATWPSSPAVVVPTPELGAPPAVVPADAPVVSSGTSAPDPFAHPASGS